MINDDSLGNFIVDNVLIVSLEIHEKITIILSIMENFIFFSDLSIQGTETEPEFDGTITNVTFPAGREAILTCSVKNLDKYKVSLSSF